MNSDYVFEGTNQGICAGDIYPVFSNIARHVEPLNKCCRHDVDIRSTFRTFLHSIIRKGNTKAPKIKGR